MIIEVKRRDHVQRMTYDEFEARIQDGEIAADTPVRFDAVTGDEFLAAGELELYRALADPHQIQFRKNLTDVGVPIATALLVGFQIRVYLWAWVPGVDTWLQEHFTNWAPAVLENGEVYRLFTYGLLHLGFTHILPAGLDRNRLSSPVANLAARDTCSVWPAGGRQRQAEVRFILRGGTQC